MDSVDNSINLDQPVNVAPVVSYAEDEMVVVDDESNEASPPSVEVDKSLLALPFDKDVILFADQVANGMPLDTVRWYLTLSPAQRKDLAEVFVGAARATPETMSIDVVKKFAEANKATRNHARYLKVMKTVWLHTLLGFHQWMMRQPDVAFLNATSEEDEDGKIVLTIGYKRDRYVVTIPLNVGVVEFGALGVKWNQTLKDMFADRPYKPQIRALPPNAYNIITRMFLVGDLKYDDKGTWVRYEPYGDPKYCPVWQDEPRPMPSKLREFYHEIWVRNFRAIDRPYLTEVTSHWEYVAAQLIKEKYRFAEEPPETLHGFSFVERDFVKQFNSANNGLFPTTYASEIEICVKAIQMARGFRGTKAVLDDLTHSMFEAKPLGVLGDSVNHSRMIAYLDQALVDLNVKSVVLFAEKYSGEVEQFLRFITKRKRPYIVTVRVHILESQPPVVLKRGDKTETSFDLNHDQTPVSAEFGADAMVWFHQNPSEVKKGVSNYFQANEEVHKALLKEAIKLGPRLLFVPVHLSYLSADDSFGKLAAGAERLEVLPQWSRGHNTEMWLRFSGRGEVSNPENVTKLNFAFALAGRRRKHINKLRNYLISGGHVFECHGLPMSNEMAEEALHVYCTVHTYTVSKKTAATTTMEYEKQREQASYPDMEQSFPKLSMGGAPSPGKGGRRSDAKQQKRDRSPSVGSQGSSDNENNNAARKQTHTPPRSPEQSLKDNRRKKGSKDEDKPPAQEKRTLRGKRSKKD